MSAAECGWHRRSGSSCPCEPERPLLSTSRVFTSQGRAGFRLPAPLASRGLRASGLTAIAQQGRTRQPPKGGRRSRELRPNPLRSDTPCRDTAAPPAGTGAALADHRGLACRWHTTADGRNDAAARPRRLREHSRKAKGSWPPVRPACASRPPAPPREPTLRWAVRRAPADRSNDCNDPLARVAQRRTARPTAEPLTRSRHLGQGSPPPALREELRARLHPRCLPSRSRRRRAVGLSPGTAPSTGRNPQIVTNLWSALGALFTPAPPPALTGRR